MAIPYWAELVLLGFHSALSGAMQATLVMYMPPLDKVPRTLQNEAYNQRVQYYTMSMFLGYSIQISYIMGLDIQYFILEEDSSS